MKIILKKDEVEKLENAGLCILDCDAEDPDITFERLEGKRLWKMDIHHRQEEPRYVYTQLIVPEEMVKQYVETAGGVFEIRHAL